MNYETKDLRQVLLNVVETKRVPLYRIAQESNVNVQTLSKLLQGKTHKIQWLTAMRIYRWLDLQILHGGSRK